MTYMLEQSYPLSRGVSRPLLHYLELRGDRLLACVSLGVRDRTRQIIEMKRAAGISKPLVGEMTAGRRQLRAIAGAKTPRNSGHNSSIAPYRPLMIFYQGRTRRELEALGR
jgi:hypothetical protein